MHLIHRQFLLFLLYSFLRARFSLRRGLIQVKCGDCTGQPSGGKDHFFEAMSTITPAAHRGSIINSRPLSPIVSPCLQGVFHKAIGIISDIFLVLTVSLEVTNFAMLSYGSAISLVYRPKLLLHGDDGVGLDHVGPAVLHELEKFPVHSLALPS
ncbi:hypothetical protein OROHE_000157 [Orobanche hederae]